MPVRIGQLITNRRPLTIPVDDDAIKLVYQPGRLTIAAIDELQGAMEKGNQLLQMRILPRLIAELVTEWDLLDNDGTPYPLNEESIRRLPLEVLGLIWRSINEDASPNSKSGARSSKTSAAGSQPKGSKASAPSGTHTFERPGISE